MAELKPCPFCGEKLKQYYYGAWEHINNDCILAYVDSEYGAIQRAFKWLLAMVVILFIAIVGIVALVL